MKKIGIISLYYKNRNYGGLLQAYAMVKAINKMGYNAEQICLERNKTYNKDIRKVFNLMSFVKGSIKNVINCFIDPLIELRNRRFKEFEEIIPHSKVYDKDTVIESTREYEIFLAGSDQIWNKWWYRPEYFLEFVPSDLYKFSYSASMPDINLSEKQKNLIKKHLSDFKSISVRECKTAEFLSELIGTEVECVVDPTLLLDKDDWNEICTEKIIDKEYIFCYFLGRNKSFKKEITKFAKKNKLKIVTLPHLVQLNPEDFFFGDYKLYDVGPEGFISLIKNAEFVFTDSFHAGVFSNLYKTKYYIFNRNEKNDMNERIMTLLKLFNSTHRFIISVEEFKNKLNNDPVTFDEEKLKEEKEKSITYLRKNLINSIS